MHPSLSLILSLPLPLSLSLSLSLSHTPTPTLTHTHTHTHCNIFWGLTHPALFFAFCMSLIVMCLSATLCVPYTQEQHDLLSQRFKQANCYDCFLTHVAPNSSRDFLVTPERIVPSKGGVAISGSTFVQKQ